MPTFRLLTQRLQLAVLALVALAAVLLVSLVARDQREDYLLHHGTEMEDNLRHDAMWLGEELTELAQQVQFIAETPPVRGLMRASRNGGIDPRDGSSRRHWTLRLQQILAAFIDAHPLYYRVSYIGTADGGRELVRVERRGEQPVAAANAELAGHAGDADLRETMALPDGEIYMSDFGLGTATDAAGNRRRRLHAAVPIRADDGSVFGVIRIYMDAGSVLDKMKAMPRDEVLTYVAAQTGEFLVHPERADGAAGPARRLGDELPELAPLLAPEAPALLPLRLMWNGQENVYLAAQRVPFDFRHPERALLVAYALPERVVHKALEPAHYQAARVGSAIGLLIVALAMYVVGRLLAPLGRLTEAARAIAAGDEMPPLPAERRGEVGALTGAFRLMQERLADRDRDNRNVRESLIASQEKLNGILDSLNDIIWSATHSGAMVYVNAAAERILGQPRETLLASDGAWIGCVHVDDRARVERKRSQASRDGVLDHEYRIVRRDGGIRWLHERAWAIRGDDGRIVRFDGIATDVTELKRSQEDYRLAGERIKSLLAHLESVREEQSATLARAVHDEIGGALTMLNLGLDSVRRKADDRARLDEHLASMQALAQEAIKTVRRIATNLRPDMLDNLGLIPAIQGHVAEFARLTGIATEVTLLPGCSLPDCARPECSLRQPARRIAAFRIVQEALTNVARHAHARQVRLALAREGDELCIEVRDNGVGMNGREAGFGILGMRERAEYLGGTLDIGSSPAGTVVNLRVPLNSGATEP